MIIRFVIGVKVIAWLILRLFTNVPHPISEIEIYLVYIIFDTWILRDTTEIKIQKFED
jgi:hypothetical protein